MAIVDVLGLAVQFLYELHRWQNYIGLRLLAQAHGITGLVCSRATSDRVSPSESIMPVLDTDLDWVDFPC